MGFTWLSCRTCVLHGSHHSHHISDAPPHLCCAQATLMQWLALHNTTVCPCTSHKARPEARSPPEPPSFQLHQQPVACSAPAYGMLLPCKPCMQASHASLPCKPPMQALHANATPHPHPDLSSHMQPPHATTPRHARSMHHHPNLSCHHASKSFLPSCLSSCLSLHYPLVRLHQRTSATAAHVADPCGCSSSALGAAPAAQNLQPAPSRTRPEAGSLLNLRLAPSRTSSMPHSPALAPAMMPRSPDASVNCCHTAHATKRQSSHWTDMRATSLPTRCNERRAPVAPPAQLWCTYFTGHLNTGGGWWWHTLKLSPQLPLWCLNHLYGVSHCL